MTETPARFAAGLSLENVAVSRGGRRILAGVSLRVEPGEAVLVKGPNGAGKTTLLRAAAGLLPPAEGRIAVTGTQGGAADSATGEEPADSPAARRAFVVYCGHADGTKPALTAAENVAFWARLYGAPRARAAEALDAVGLAALADRRAGVLSAGQKRRLGLARLIVSGKPVWLLDEPAASIDTASVERLTAMIDAHRRRGGAALIATHDRLSLDGARAVVVDPGAGAP